MAGFYTDAPAARMAWDVDGSQFVEHIVATGALNLATQGQMTALNDETQAAAGWTSSGAWNVVIFPQLRDLRGLIWSQGSSISFPGYQTSACAVSTSVDTTNGLDGTWVSRTAVAGPTSTKPGYRTQITTYSVDGIKAVRIQPFYGNNTGIYLHIYGNISAGQTPDRLRLWHPTLDQPLSTTPAFFDWGDAQRGSTASRDFRVKNNSATLTAGTITCSMEFPTDASPTLVGQLQFSTAALPTYTNTKVIADLTPGVISPLITLRRTTPSNAALSLWSGRLAAVAATMA
jgi:hypothetical protein